MGLRAVLDEDEAVPRREGRDRVHVRDAPVEVDGQHRLRPRRERRLESPGVHREAILVDVDEHGGRARAEDSRRGRRARHRHREDLVPAPTPSARRASVIASVPFATPTAARGAARRRPTRLSNAATSAPEDVTPAPHGGEDGGGELGLLGGRGAREVEVRDGAHGGGGGPRGGADSGGSGRVRDAARRVARHVDLPPEPEDVHARREEAAEIEELGLAGDAVVVMDREVDEPEAGELELLDELETDDAARVPQRDALRAPRGG